LSAAEFYEYTTWHYFGRFTHAAARKGGRSSVDSMTWMKDGTPVVILYSVQNGGHAMPLAGEDLDSPVAIRDFFSKLPSR
jgi:hypothetical protein